MAFPAPVGTPTTYSDNTGTLSTHPVTLPSGMTVGNKLFVLLAVNSNPTITDPSGYTLLAQSATPLSYDSIRLYGRDIDGTEGSTVSIVLSSVQRASAISWEVSGGRSGFTTNEVDLTTFSEQGSISNPNPPSLTPAPGADDYLWMVMTTRGDGNATFTSHSANYTIGQQTVITGAGNGNALSVCMRQLNAATEDPGVTTWSNNKFSGAITVAVRPAGPVGIAPGNPPLSIPSPIIYPVSSKTFIDSLKLGLKDEFYGAEQFPHYEWPLPLQPRRPVSNLTHIDTLKLHLLGQDAFYGPGQFPRYDWPLPQPLPRNRDLFTWIDVFSDVPVPPPPIIPAIWPIPVPIVLPVALRTWTNTLIPTSLPPIRPYNWPIPMVPQRAQAFFSTNAIITITAPITFPPARGMQVNPQWRRYPNELRTWTSFVIPPIEHVSVIILG